MRIKAVHIKNYRSIKDLTFFPADSCALVGENNAGKTNILKALNFLLGETWPSKRSLELSDYYDRDSRLPIYIEVEFESNPYDIKSIWCRVEEDGSVSTKVQYENERVFNLTTAIRERCALIYLDTNRDLEYHLGSSRWSLFGRVIRQLAANFAETASVEHREKIEANFRQAHDLMRTDLYQAFEKEFKVTFHEQIKRTTHSIEIAFETFDPQNLFRSVQTLLCEDGIHKNPAEAGQGMRNLIILALFRAYARVFKDDAIIAIEEPEIFLHPHAQRSLAGLFDDLAAQGNQTFFSTHSGYFLDIERFDRICLVEKRLDSTGHLCTQVRQVSTHDLLLQRQQLHPAVKMNTLSLRKRYGNICKLEHNEAFFAKKIILVEGESEENALPIFAQYLGYDLDAHGVSVVNAHGKNNLDQLYQLYSAFGIPVYLIFDNDRGKKDQQNLVLLRMLGEPEVLEPDGIVTEAYAILEGDFEREMRRFMNSSEAGKYEEWDTKMREIYGANTGKGIAARLLAQSLTKAGLVPSVIQSIIEAVREHSSLPAEVEAKHTEQKLEVALKPITEVSIFSNN